MIQRWAGKDGFTVTQGPFPKMALVLGMFMACRSSESCYSHFLALTLTSSFSFYNSCSWGQTSTLAPERGRKRHQLLPALLIQLFRKAAVFYSKSGRELATGSSAPTSGPIVHLQFHWLLSPYDTPLQQQSLQSCDPLFDIS